MRALPALIAILVSLLAVPALAGAAYPPQSPPAAYHGQVIPKNPDEKNQPASNEPIAGYAGPLLEFQIGSLNAGAAEPTIGVDKNGVSFVAGARFDGVLPGLGHSHLFRSTNGGTTWEELGARTQFGVDLANDLDPYVYTDPDYPVVFEVPLTGSGSVVNRSDDAGATWTTSYISSTGANDHQTVVTAKPPVKAPAIVPADERFPKIFYYCVNSVSHQACSRSVDGAQTFEPTLTPAWEADPACFSLGGQLSADSQGRIFLPTGRCHIPELAISEDGGDTWERVYPSTEVGAADSHTAVAVDRADNLYYTWFDNLHHRLWLSVSVDHGKTWSTPRMIAPPGVRETNFPAISAGDPGRIAITFPGTTAPSGDEDPEHPSAARCTKEDGGSSNCDPGRPWDTYVVVSTNALDANPTFVAAPASPNGDPIHRGDCAGRCAGMFDFLKIVTSPQDAGFWATAVDDCLVESGCADGRDAEGSVAQTKTMSFVVRQTGGPWLVGNGPGGTATPPAPGGPSAIAPLVDKVAPHIRGFKVRVGKRTKQRPQVAFSKLSEAATLRVVIKKGKKSLLVTRKFAPRGAGRVDFKKRLKTGRYVATIQAVDAAGNRSRIYTYRFRVTRLQLR